MYTALFACLYIIAMYSYDSPPPNLFREERYQVGGLLVTKVGKHADNYRVNASKPTTVLDLSLTNLSLSSKRRINAGEVWSSLRTCIGA